MSIEFRTCEAGELVAALNPIWHYFGRGPSDEDVERMGHVLPTDRVHVAVEDGKVVGGAGAYKFDTTVPGGARVPTAGVVAVGVLPTHRRRGILRGLMRKEIDDVREWGEPLATLYASEGAIYRRYGYGPASISGDIALPCANASFYATPPSVGHAAHGHGRGSARALPTDLRPGRGGDGRDAEPDAVSGGRSGSWLRAPG